MELINQYLIVYMIGPLVGGADVDELSKKYYSIDGNNEKEVKDIIRKEILPEFISNTKNMQLKCKQALSYYLTTDKADFERIFNGNLLPFDCPNDPKLFFIWLWEALFAGDNFLFQNPESYLPNYDSNLLDVKKW
jgi:hypothetical protein